jgi:predicted ArsR family transcriptional regulator
VATLTARFGLNHNAIRQHLAKLSDAGLVIEETAPPTGPGRRRLRYRPAPEVEGSWGTHGPYQQLSLMLLQLLQEGSSAREVGAETGRRLARALPQTADPVDRLELNATRQGFAPRRVDRGSSVELILDRCPFQAAASAAPEVVCQLHRGLAEGIAKATAGQVEVIDLISRNPQRAGCRLKLVRGTSDD